MEEGGFRGESLQSRLQHRRDKETDTNGEKVTNLDIVERVVVFDDVSSFFRSEN